MIWDERIEEALRNHDAYINCKNEGEEIGIDIGMEQKQNEMVINMYEEKIDIDTISKIAKIPVDEVKKIINSNK